MEKQQNPYNIKKCRRRDGDEMDRQDMWYDVAVYGDESVGRDTSDFNSQPCSALVSQNWHLLLRDMCRPFLRFLCARQLDSSPPKISKRVEAYECVQPKRFET